MFDLSLAAALICCAAISTFSVVFRRTHAELCAARSRGVPRAVATSRAHAPPPASFKARATALTPSLQAGLVAAAAASIVVMAACLMLCIVLALRGG